ncbi:DUF4476 domain-containing protein [Aquimarina sediminis]|uniref:DUF4476 domain-containing protein n=1 Tax=Aquimarina sediminis TaxID=2070536 RepID=UPI000CA0342D|nr:DUF4476 domain-containing protein [Aquimarina sediminis]
MKKIAIALILVMTSTTTFSQDCNVVFFNQNGDRFQVILNGILQNIGYETNVKITDLHFEGSYKVTIVFENNQLPDIQKSIYLTDRNSEYTYNIKKNRKDKYVLRALSIIPLPQAPISPPAQSVIVFSTTPPASVSTTTSTVSTTTNTTPNDQDNISMGINIGGAELNVNIGITDDTYSETTTTTTTTYSTTNNNPPIYENEPIATNNHYVMPGYNGSIGCSYPMSDTDFNSVKESISTKTFHDTKLTLAKQITSTNCLTSEQAKQIILLFNFEDDKLEYAKHAYGYIYDLSNYYKVNDAFLFELTIEELNDYIRGR